MLLRIFDGVLLGAMKDFFRKAKLMRKEFELSMMKELTFFLELQIKQEKEGIIKKNV